MANAAPSPIPQRLPAGATTDPPWGPWADSGMTNPFFYHQFNDDFDNALGPTGLWTVSETGSTVAHTPGDGGLALFTTGASAADYASIQLPAADFLLPQGTTLGKKLFFLTRLQTNNLTNVNIIAGLIDTTSTPYTAITDGVYFSLSAGVLSIITVSASTAVTWAVPTAAYSAFLANNVNVDLGFYVDKYQNLNVFVGPQLVGYLPQSGTSSASSVSGVSVLPVVGRVLQVTGANYSLAPAAPAGAPWTVTAANLNPTLGIKNIGAAGYTMTVDFIGVQKER
jgi:hypothetical protein